NALRELHGGDIFLLPTGRVRLLLRAKGRRVRREVELSPHAALLLSRYIEAFNGAAAGARRPERIGAGIPGPAWRSGWRRQWAHGRTVAREVSQLRSLARQAPPTGGSRLQELFADPGVLARTLLHPAAPIAASTGRARLVAAQRFVRACGSEVGVRDGDEFVAT